MSKAVEGIKKLINIAPEVKDELKEAAEENKPKKKKGTVKEPKKRTPDFDEDLIEDDALEQAIFDESKSML